MSFEKVLLGLVPTSCEKVLAECAERTRKTLQGTPTRQIRVTVHLKSGKELQGYPLAVGEARETVLIKLERPGGGADVAHVPFNSVEAVTVHDAGAMD